MFTHGNALIVHTVFMAFITLVQKSMQHDHHLKFEMSIEGVASETGSEIFVIKVKAH